MREQWFITRLEELGRYLINAENKLKIAFTGEALRASALQAVLIKKGHITETELKEAISEEIKKMNAAVAPEPAAPAAPELIVPTPAQVATVNDPNAQPPVNPA